MALLIYRRRLFIKTFTTALIKTCATCLQGERTIRRGRPPIGGQENDRVSYLCSAPYTLLPLRGISPQGETRDLRRKTAGHILHVPFRCVPFWWLAPPPFPLFEGALWVLSHGAMSLQESIERFILSPGWGKVRRSRIRGSRVAANHQNANHAL